MKRIEMNLGYFGHNKEEMDVLLRIFKTAEQLRFPVKKEYDICYFDITYASQRVFEFLYESDAMPLLITRHFDPAQEKLGFLHEDSYLVLNPYLSDYSEQELIEKIEEYLQRFEEKKSEYQYYKENWKKRKKN